jgi:phage gp36-like protein
VAYLTQTDLEERIGPDVVLQLADRDHDGIVDLAAVAAAIADADAEINSYLAPRYALPLATAPDIVKRLSAMIARYNLWRRDLPEDHPAYVAYRDALKTLQQIANGVVSLPLASGTAGATPVGGVAYATPSATFDTAGMLD